LEIVLIVTAVVVIGAAIFIVWWCGLT